MAVDDTRLAAAAGNLRVDSVTAEVVTALREVGARPIVLKGPAVARWLYDTPGERAYSDSDLLVAPSELGTAERALRKLGFEPGAAGWLRLSRAWMRAGRELDLHTSLFGVGATPGEAWAVFSRDTEPMRVGGIDVEVLATPARALHVATHAVQHPLQFAHPHADLERAIARLPRSTWEAASRLATELRALPAFTAGLSRIEGGKELMKALSLDVRPSAAVALRAGDGPPIAIRFEEFAAAESVRLRLALLVRAFFPRRSRIRQSSSLARRGEAGLALAYIMRVARLARSTPAAVATWRRARR